MQGADGKGLKGVVQRFGGLDGWCWSSGSGISEACNGKGGREQGDTGMRSVK